MRALRRVGRIATLLLVLAVAILALFVLTRARPQDLPWTPLDLGQPVGRATGGKIVGLRNDFPRCNSLLRRAGVHLTALPPRREGAQCGYDDAVRLLPGGSRSIRFAPANLGVACPVAVALSLWEWEVVQPAASRLLGSDVAEIEHLGSYNCRRIYGRAAGTWSEHATADAVDIAGFRLSDGRRITVARDWQGKGPEATFLRAVRNGACRVFSTVLSPDYNAAHADHLHLDEADRGAMGWRACR